MLIIAIGFGSCTDPYSCSVSATRVEVPDPSNMEDVLVWVMNHHKLAREEIDELIVVENDDVLCHFGTVGPIEDEYEPDVIDASA